MIHFFTFDGKSSRDCGLVISGGQTFGAPERDAEQVEIPGRNGALTISRNRFKNITVSYSAFLRRDFAENAAALRAWLLGGEGYRRLEDTYHPDSFRMARFSGPLEFETGFLNRTGEVTLSFDCKPQRFLKSGELAAAYTAPAVLYNDGFPALPLIKVMGTGAGNLYAGGVTVRILALDGYLYLDSDTQNAYKGTLNQNSAIRAPEFPVLQPGKNTVSWDGGVAGVEITPRWWTV